MSRRKFPRSGPILCIVLLGWRGFMSSKRQAQWTYRLERLHALRARFTGTSRYDRAYKAYLAIQHVYDRWADEVFAAARIR